MSRRPTAPGPRRPRKAAPAVEEREPRSRTEHANARKTEERWLVELATRLVGLTPRRLAKLDLPERVRAAVDQARLISSHAALARQLRVVRRELRSIDASEIERALGADAAPSRKPTSPEVLAWVARVLEEGDAGLDRFVSEHAAADRQQLRALRRNVATAKTDAARAKARQKLERELARHVVVAPAG